MPVIVIVSILFTIAIMLIVAERFLISYGDCAITLNNERNISVKGGDSLLSYLTSNKIFIPSACGGKGTCGFCKVKVSKGGGTLLPTEEIYVTRQERAEGVRMACQVKIRSSIEINIPESLLGASEMKARVGKIEKLTHDIKYVRFDLLDSERISFKPGQYIQIKIPGAGEYRAYSIASEPSKDSCVELTVRLVPGGLCSTYVHEVMEEGDSVDLTGPFGDFCLQEDSDREIVGIAGGCGMAPIRSIVHHMAERGMPRKMSYFFGARTTKDLFYTKELKDIESKHPNFKYIPALSEPRPHEKWEGEVGLITHVVDRYVKSTKNMEAYLCGPPPMIDAAIALLTKKGMDPERIYFDKF